MAPATRKGFRGVLAAVIWDPIRSTVAKVVSAVVLLGLTALAYSLVYLPYLAPGQARERELLQRQHELEQKVQFLQKVAERFQGERRAAEVVLTDQWTDQASGDPVITLRFTEYDHAGQPMPPRYLRVRGDEVYFDALVIKFENQYVAAGDALRGQSIYLFRRVFGNKQKPDEGEPIDQRQISGAPIPDVYRVDPNPSSYELQLWQDFWSYANDKEAARQQGVRVVQGEAAYTKILPGRIYTLTIQANGGINIVPGPIPAPAS